MSTYLILALLAWPILTGVLAVRCNHLRRGPTLSTVAVLAAVLALVWPLAMVGLFLAPSPERTP